MSSVERTDVREISCSIHPRTTVAFFARSSGKMRGRVVMSTRFDFITLSFCAAIFASKVSLQDEVITASWIYQIVLLLLFPSRVRNYASIAHTLTFILRLVVQKLQQILIYTISRLMLYFNKNTSARNVMWCVKSAGSGLDSPD